MSKQFSLPKINLILQKLKKGPKNYLHPFAGSPFNISCLPTQRTIAPLEEKNSLHNNMHLLVYYRISGKLPHHPSLMVTFSLDWKVCVEVRLREGWVGSFPWILYWLGYIMPYNNTRSRLLLYVACVWCSAYCVEWCTSFFPVISTMMISVCHLVTSQNCLTTQWHCLFHSYFLKCAGP